jgi:Heavy metal binding domain
MKRFGSIALLFVVWTSVQAVQAVLYYCPMHPDVTASAPNKCARCGMTLVAGDPYDLREYHLDVEASPPAPRAGQPFRLRFTVRHPSTNAVVNTFALVHEKPYHLFVISQDMEFYDHVHPEHQSDGSYVVDLTLPRAGYYRLFSDFLPIGGAPQVIPRVIATAGFAGSLESSQARLVPDTTLEKAAGDMKITLTLSAGGLIAGREETFRYQIEDARTGAPVKDVEPYLGAFGHTLVMSEDTLHYVHAHPVELLPETVGGAPAPVGGPTLTFKALLPKPGVYRVWTQIKRSGQVSTASFTVSVAAPASLKE